MSDRTWKQTARAVARLLGGKCPPRSGWRPAPAGVVEMVVERAVVPPGPGGPPGPAAA
jgi:hypothetical protein